MSASKIPTRQDELEHSEPFERFLRSKTQLCKHDDGCVSNALKKIAKILAIGYALKYGFAGIFMAVNPSKGWRKFKSA